MKVLISAYTCSPYNGSEHAVGWGFISALAKLHDLWVITEEEKCRKDIEKLQAVNPHQFKNVRFFFIRKKRDRPLRKIWPPSYYWYYRCWQREAFQLAVKLQMEVGFDIAHQLTMVGFREPGYLWKLGIPFVWGPVGGMGFFPWRFLTMVGAYGALYFIGYNMLNLLQMKLLSRPRNAAAIAAVGNVGGLIAATAENRNFIAKYWGFDSTVLSEVGLPCGPKQQILKREMLEPLRIVWTGLHIPRKALNLALIAIKELSNDVDWELHILGKGRQTFKSKQLADSLGISARCSFHGWLRRKKAIDVMKRAHLLLITSLRDLTSTVTVEALALGMPIICLDHCGFSDVVNQNCGVKIPLSSPGKVVHEIAQAIEDLSRDEGKRRVLALGALKRSYDFSWEIKARKIDQIYRDRVMVKASCKAN